MRIAWLVNFVPQPLRTEGKPASGWWISSLATRLAATGSHQLTVVACTSAFGEVVRKDHDGVQYVAFPFASAALVGASPERPLRRLAAWLNDGDYELIDVHGTEYALGAVTKFARAPVVVTLQGFVNAVLGFMCSRRYAREALGTVRAASAKRRALALMMVDWFTTLTRAASERTVIRANRHFIGRTAFDERMVKTFNPSAQYFTCNRVLRPGFYDSLWKGSDTPESKVLFSCGRLLPYKGIADLVKAVAMIKQPEIRLRIAGGSANPGYLEYLTNLASRQGVKSMVDFLGPLSESQIVRELQSCSAFVHPSLVDNSPNTVAEAMSLGVPVIATGAGGIPSMVTNNSTGILYRPGDVAGLMEAVKVILDSPKLAADLASEARIAARRRHDPAMIVGTLESIYGHMRKSR